MKQPYFEKIVSFIKEKYPGQDFIPLHAPVFAGNEKKYLLDTIDSTFVSSVGEYVKKFEEMMCEITGAKFAIATVNGTNALHMALIMAGVDRDDEVISQSLTFIATCNAISYLGASPVFVDVDKDSLGMSPNSVVDFLKDNTEKRKDGFTYNIHTGKRIKACVAMHTFGLPCRIDELVEICDSYNIAVIEDAAESIGSYYKNKHTGIYGLLGVFSFNGNKTITCGGGGAIVTNNHQLAEKAKHLTTQAKVPHKWEFVHDAIGYNYRMPNLNAALACAQLEQLGLIVENKRKLATDYRNFFAGEPVKFVEEIEDSKSNYWLNTILFDNKTIRDAFLQFSKDNGVMTRPSWTLMNKLNMFSDCQKAELTNAEWLSDRIVNIPSSFRI
jgi:aminotransferase in exopolysaccharide biosynthesis